MLTHMILHTQLYTAQMALDCVRGYNAVAGLVILLPGGGDSEVAATAARPGHLPAMLACDWKAELPHVRDVAFDKGAEL